jgi:hypothetical protein
MRTILAMGWANRSDGARFFHREAPPKQFALAMDEPLFDDGLFVLSNQSILPIKTRLNFRPAQPSWSGTR